MLTYYTKRVFSETDESRGSVSRKKRRVKTARSQRDDERWNSAYNLIVAYKEENGHCEVPRGYEKDSFKLGHWVNRQRQMKKVGKLLDEQLQKLDSIGFTWVAQARSQRSDDAWNAMYNLVVAYKEENGHCKVPQGYEKDSFKLGRWVDAQRTKKKAGKLLDERFQKLESIGFTWVMKERETFDAMCNRLAAYKEETGHCMLPQGYKEDTKLGKWVIDQRYLKKTGKLSPERIEKLDLMGFVWSVCAASSASSVTIKKEAADESKPKLRVWVEDTGDPNYV